MSKQAFIILLLSTKLLYAQYTLSGFVLDDKTNKPLSAVSIINSENRKWTVSDDKGYFSIVVNEYYSLIFKMLGKETLSIDGGYKDKQLKVFLKEDNLSLQEIIITGKSNKESLGSKTSIDKYAINQFQSFSLGSVLQQIPGKAIKTIDLTNPNILTLRTAVTSKELFKNNAFGISYVLDGLQISNDENMERYGKNNDFLFSYSNINSGFDLRNIPSSNIDEIEVIAGIPDAKYGNVTTGLIKINRQAGYSPLRIATSINRGSTSASIDKGFRIGVLNRLSTSFDYLNFNVDPRNNLEQFNRITSSAILSLYNTSKSIKNTLSTTFQTNINGYRVDEEHSVSTRSAKFKENTGIRVNNRFNYKINNFIDELNLNLGLSYFNSRIYTQNYINSGGTIAPVALESSLEKGIYTPVSYMSKREVFGEPLSISTRLAVKKHFTLKKIKNNISFGGNFNYSDNRGAGIIYNSETAHKQSTVSRNSKGGVRPLNYGKYITAQKRIGLYLQNNLKYSFNEYRNFRLNLGLRYDLQNGFSSFGPRINSALKLSKYIKIRGGLGFMSKAPSLANVYPGNFYFDYQIKDYRTNNYAFNLIQTKVKKIAKNELKPAKSWKYEIGTDISLKWVTVNLSAYYNYMYDGFGGQQLFELYKLPEIELIFTNNIKEAPTYKISKETPFIQAYSIAKNLITNTDKGIELAINFKKIKAINTSFSLSGNYTNSEVKNDAPMTIKTSDVAEKEFLIGYYDRQPEKYDFSSFRFITTHHIPRIKLLCSLTTECFPFSTKYSQYSSVYPYAYRNSVLKYKEIPKGQRKENTYANLFLNQNIIKERRNESYFNFHLRFTKEMLSGLSVSLHATNFLNHQPKVKFGDGTIYANQEVSFGGTIKYLF